MVDGASEDFLGHVRELGLAEETRPGDESRQRETSTLALNGRNGLREH